MWVEFVVGSHPCSMGFSLGSLVLQIPIQSRNEGHRFVSFAVKCHPHKIKLIMITNYSSFISARHPGFHV